MLYNIVLVSVIYQPESAIHVHMFPPYANQNYNEVSSHTSQNGHHHTHTQKILQTINPGEGIEKREPSCTVGSNANWHSHNGEQYGASLKN